MCIRDRGWRERGSSAQESAPMPVVPVQRLPQPPRQPAHARCNRSGNSWRGASHRASRGGGAGKAPA
eukprot:10144461-Alexandrium_andersonii.AAC.1